MLMPGQHLIVGGFLVLLGLILIAYYKEVARQIVEGSKLSRIWAVKDGEYILWRILSLVIGAALALAGSFVLLNSL